MKTDRVRFVAALAAGVVLLGIGVGLSWSARIAAPMPGAEPAVSSTSGSESASQHAPAAAGHAEPRLAPLQLTPQRSQSIGVRIGEAQRRPVEDRISTTGNVAVDETKLAYVQVRFSGYIQKVFVDATYQYVRKGQPLFTIYSPDLVATEREYLLAKQSQQQLARSADTEVARDADSLVEAAAARLSQWNIPRREVRRLESSGRARQELEIDSPVAGYVIEREALPNKFVQPDTRLYTVADLSTIWVLAQVYQSDLGRIRAGDAATLTVDTYPGRTFSGRVDFIYPHIDMATRTARVRLVFPNPRLELIPGMFVTVALRIPMGEQLVIPASGVLESGTRAIAFVDRGGGRLEPREVELGARVGDQYVVLKGLRAGEKIVTSANFLIDSESQLQAAVDAFAPPPAAVEAASAAGVARASQAAITLTSDPNPPRKGRNLFHVRLTSASGAPITGAQVAATLYMAAMPAMGMAAMRVPITLSDRGNGLYEGSGEIRSGGTWQVTVVAQKGGEVIASRQLTLSAAGGM